MKRLNHIRNLFAVAALIVSANQNDISAQVSIRDRIQITGKDMFNYPGTSASTVKTKKSNANRIVYSDRNGTQSYEGPYFQRKRVTYGIGTPYYIVGEKNGNYKVVLADADITGKPKSIFGFLYNSKRHFKEPDKVDYAGWIPSDNMLMYDHAYLNPRNNRPIKYRVGINSIDRLYDINQFFKGDTLRVYDDPFLKNKMDAGVVTGEIVYLYKLDRTGKAALVSNAPALSDTTKRFLGWVPFDLIAEVGQNEVFAVDYVQQCDSMPCAVEQMTPDTLMLHNVNMQGTILFDSDGNQESPLLNRNVRLSYPLSVWDRNWNTIINIKGGDIMVSDIRKMETENKDINLHVVFYDSDRLELAPYVNVLQNLKLKTRPNYNYTYSATCISANGRNKHLPATVDFAEWLDYIKRQMSVRQENKKDSLSSFSGFEGAMKQLTRYNPGKRFGNNIIVILGTDQTLSITERQLSQLAKQPARLLFVQIDRASDMAYQDFLLQAKSILGNHSTKYTDHISNYIADNKLAKMELFRNIEATDANVYLFDAPENSLSVGGLVFPKGRNKLGSTAFETALDTLFLQSFEMDSLLLHSLKDYERNIGVLRSRPTSGLTYLFNNTEHPDYTSLNNIDRNSVNDTYYIRVSVADSIMSEYEHGYLFDDAEVTDLLQSYRGLLPEFSDSVGKKELKMLRKLFDKERKNIERGFYRKMLPQNPYLSQILYYKTGITACDSILNTMRVKDLKSRKVKSEGFNDNYNFLISKMKKLEDMYQRNLFRPVFMAGKKYYFIPKELTL